MKIGIMTIAAEFELPYLKEWIEYHLQIVDQIILGINNWNPSSVPMWLGDYTKDRLRVISVEGEKMQMPFYNRMLQSSEHDYMIDLDVDEFLVSKEPVKDIIKRLESVYQYDSIYVNWRLYGDSGLHFTGDFNVLDRFKMADSKLHTLGKHIINVKHKDIYVHDPHILLKTDKSFSYTIDTLGNRLLSLPNKIKPIEGQIIEIAHFRNKTWEEHINRKYYRSDSYYGHSYFANDLTKLRELFDEHNTNEIEKKVGYNE